MKEQMKHLTIIYNPGTGPVQLYDGPIDELAWHDSPTGVRVDGKVKPATRASSGLADLLSAAAKHKSAPKNSEVS